MDSVVLEVHATQSWHTSKNLLVHFQQFLSAVKLVVRLPHGSVLSSAHGFFKTAGRLMTRQVLALPLAAGRFIMQAYANLVLAFTLAFTLVVPFSR